MDFLRNFLRIRTHAKVRKRGPDGWRNPVDATKRPVISARQKRLAKIRENVAQFICVRSTKEPQLTLQPQTSATLAKCELRPFKSN
jgi:hypothetical protein